MAHITLCIFLTLLATLLTHTLAQNATVTATTTTTATALTRTVDIFYLNERAFAGLPYTLFHRDSGSVVAVDTVNSLTTYVITTTRVDRRTSASATDTDDNATTAIPTLAPIRSGHGPPLSGTGQPSTITQGPATFMFTGARFAPDHTVINRCSLNGTAHAACNLTHVGSVWYTRDEAWDGVYSTYRYDWTSGDRFGFAPVTITEGAEMLLLGGGGVLTASGGAAASSSSGPSKMVWRGNGIGRVGVMGGLVWGFLVVVVGLGGVV